MSRIACLVLIASVSVGQLSAQEPVSFHKQIKPILQAHCQGCHQPAKRGGDYLMTSYAGLLKEGESGLAGIVAGKPDESYLLDQITPVDGEAEMPKGKPPLSEDEINLIKSWIKQGAKDDSPQTNVRKYDSDHPPVYTRPPVVTSIDFAPDGSLLAVAGFHEVLLRSADGAELLGRLIGLSERIESVAFSPDGKRLLVAGGQPGRMGEVQIWSVADTELELSIPLTADTVYGASWSPDGSMVVVGCSDNIVRGFHSNTGEQVFFNGAHDDWPLDTVVSKDGSHIVSVGRDMATKLYKVETERFVDNVTSITPGALKGGLAAIARHPEKDAILVGGSDGVPRTYRMERVTKRVIGDDANLLKRYPPLKGRIFAVTYSPDGKSIACGSSLNGTGQVFTYASDVDLKMPDEIKKIVEKRVSQQNTEEKKTLEDYITSGTDVLTKTDIDAGVYALAYSPDGLTIVASGSDGLLRFIDTTTGEVKKEVLPVELESADSTIAQRDATWTRPDDALVGTEKLPGGSNIVSIDVTPPGISLVGDYDYSQLLVTAKLESGDIVDVTRIAKIKADNDTVSVSTNGRVTANSAGQSDVHVSLADQSVTIPVTVIEQDIAHKTSFIKDVNPVLSRLGCNQGTCHGSKDGKNGFKLSLRGYDPLYDVRSFSDDIKSRRTNVASADDSLMLLKASGAVPHVGGQLTKPGEPYYEIIRKWIAEGAELDLDVPRVESISLTPENPVIQSIDARQQIRVVATYTDGTTRDVTGEAFIESGNTEVAEVNRAAIVTALRRGEAPMLARFEGSYAATTVTVMGDRDGFQWKEPKTWTEVDQLVAEKWQRMKIQPSGLCTDAEFIRRVYLDLTGLPPSAEAVQAFLEDNTKTRKKRSQLVNKLVGSEEFVEYWTNKWADLLQVNRKFLGAAGAKEFRGWIRDHVKNNTPYDEFAYQVLTASGSNKENPAASYYKILREPDAMMENTTHLFLAVRFNCNKCHDHPFERWTQDQYYETAAFFAQVGMKRDPDNKDGNIGGTAVEGAKPLWEVIYDKDDGEITHDRTGAVTAPVVPYDREMDFAEKLTRREKLAEWITDEQNDYFAKSYVNRVWGYLMGVGLIEPLDDIRAGNPASNPELLDHLTREFIASDFNVQQLMKTICKSRTYQLSIATNEWNQDDNINYSHAYPKRLPAEVLYDSVYSVTGSKMEIPGVPEGTRAAAIPDSGIQLKDGFLANLGRPVRESACECERSSDLQLGPVMALMNGPTVSNAISQPANAIEQLTNSTEDNRQLVNELFMRVLNRPADDREIDAATKLLGTLEGQHKSLVSELARYEKSIAPVLEKRQQRRLEAIKQAEDSLAKYTEESKPAREAAAKARQEKIEKAKQAIGEHLATASDRLTEWEKTAETSGTPWAALEFSEMKSTTGAKLAKQDDLSIFVSGPNNKKGAYVLTGSVEPTKITGIKIEALTDDRLPNRGPGRPPNGNFVLTEFTVQAWKKDKPNKKTTLKLTNAKADFSQGGYDVKTAIDGKKPNSGNGWATSPKTGEDRTATFELEKPFEVTPETVLQLTLDQNYQDNKHTLGKFRISITDAATPVNFGNSRTVIEIVKKPVDQRTEEEQAELLEFFNSRDEELQKRKKALAEAEKAAFGRSEARFVAKRPGGSQETTP